jgi:hypothetical protein
MGGKEKRKERSYQKGNVKYENIYIVYIKIPIDFGVIVANCISIKLFLLKELLPFVNIKREFGQECYLLIGR